MPINEADKSYDHDKIEKKVQKFWKDEDTFKKVNELREKGPKYSFLDGPPYCSGKIHLGTAWNKVIKEPLKKLFSAFFLFVSSFSTNCLFVSINDFVLI